MCGGLQLTTTERLRTEKALRKELGSGSNSWTYAGFVSEKGIRLNEEGQLTWGGLQNKLDPERKFWRGPIHEIFPVEILAFSDRSIHTQHVVWFDARIQVEKDFFPGKTLVPVFKSWKHPGQVCFGIVTGLNRQVAALCKHDRGPVILHPEHSLDGWKSSRPILALAKVV